MFRLGNRTKFGTIFEHSDFRRLGPTEQMGAGFDPISYVRYGQLNEISFGLDSKIFFYNRTTCQTSEI